VVCALAGVVAVGLTAGSADAQKTVDLPGMTSAAPTWGASRAKPLAGKVIVINPGHQLGNATHPRKINRLVNAGGFLKACDTTGTATNGGFPEATFAWRVSQALRHQLQRRGATVYRTRHTNSYADWGPCIDVRGRRGNEVHADAVVSIHGDGAVPGVRGFFVIRPADRPGWTADIYRSSRRLAVKVRSGLVSAGARVSNAYGGDGLDVRGDLGTLNWSDVPAVMVELGNMRNATDAHHMTSRHYRDVVYARGLRRGLTRFVRHH
jgi:N-acetylmuramoyl-L-alanine amidase